MLFWVFMTFTTIIVPLILFTFGNTFKDQAPAAINNSFGYRTKRAKQNMGTWKFAHTYIGKLWFKLGRILFIISPLSMLLVWSGTTKEKSIWGLIVVLIQLVILFITIFMTENALKRTFDKDGNRR